MSSAQVLSLVSSFDTLVQGIIAVDMRHRTADFDFNNSLWAEVRAGAGSQCQNTGRPQAEARERGPEASHRGEKDGGQDWRLRW
jgi:hypothetical protein